MIPHHRSVLIHLYTEAAGNESVPGDDNGYAIPNKEPGGKGKTTHGFENNMEESDIVLQILVSRRQP